ncbi:hypothetical protein EVG20_g1978 [Dentipellis fragilis]|uniref:F-box domain-containing protein n=1 Tax=Dentipellis fragilis TaxID=205917 RepID=A0A4Y9Z915_9AGAM|nr:hypothetical protein EVG20_g1978 [Dentipellis fragilis]
MTINPESTLKPLRVKLPSHRTSWHLPASSEISVGKKYNAPSAYLLSGLLRRTPSPALSVYVIMENVSPPSSQPCHVSRLPVELMCKIFLLPNAECHDERAVIKYASQRHSIWVSHVCRRWRAVALHTPALWAVIYVNPVKFHPDRLDAFLERSISHPLTISIYTRGPRRLDLRLLGQLYASLLSRLQVHSPRWLALDIATQNEKLRNKVLDVLQNFTVPALRRFRFWCNVWDPNDPGTDWYAEPHYSLLPFHGQMTQLEDLYLESTDMWWAHCRLQNLKSLSLVGFPSISLEELLDLLSSCPGLLSFTLQTLSLHATGEEVNIVTVPALETFLLNLAAFCLPILWNCLRLPKLRSLTLYPVGSDHTFALPLLTNPHPAAQASPPPCWYLTSLTFWPRSESIWFTGVLFNELPNVRVLFLCPNDREAANTCIRDLTKQRSSIYADDDSPAVPEMVVPCLTTLMIPEGRCSNAPITDVSWDLLQHLVASRRAAGVPLKKIFIEHERAWARGPPEKATWLMENLEAFGMMPKSWKLQTLHRYYAEDCCAIEAEPAAHVGVREIVRAAGVYLIQTGGETRAAEGG